jgi:hypothetical protein
MELGDIQVRDFVVSKVNEDDGPEKTIHNVFMVSDLT